MKTKKKAILLAVFLGNIGLHKFYLGRPIAGVVYALFFWTLVPWVLALIDAIVYASMSREAWDERYNMHHINAKRAYTQAVQATN